MTAFLASLCALLGLAIGSFLNVVVWRVPRGESVVRPPSHCPGCAAPIAPRDNIPVVSWLLLRRACRSCGSPISARYPLVELSTAALFAAAAVRFGADPVLPAYLYLMAISVALALIDVDHKRLPNAIVLPSYPVAVALLAAGVLGDAGPDRLLAALLGGGALYAVYFALALAYPAGMGFGDVKLAGVLGLYLGWFGWAVWAVGLLAGFFSGGLAGVVLLVGGRAGRKTAIPYGPFMLVGALLAVFWGDPIADLWLAI